IKRKQGPNVHHQASPERDHGSVEPSGPRRTVTHGQHKTSNQEDTVKPREDDTQDLADSTEEIFCAQTRGENLEDEEEITNSEPGEDHVDGLEEGLDQESNLPEE